MPPIILNTPVVSSVGNVLVLAMEAKLGVDDTFTQVYLSYIACTAQGTPLPGAVPQSVALTTADLVAFIQASGSFRLRAQAALLSNLGVTGVSS